MTHALGIACAALLAPIPAAARQSVALVPPDAVLVAALDIREDDPGQKWVFAELMRYLVSRGRRGEREAEVGDVNLFRFSDFVFALLPISPAREEQMLMTARLLPGDGRFEISYGRQKFQLNVRDEKSAAGSQAGLLSLLLRLACDVPADTPPDGEIFYNPEGEAKGRFSAFTVSDERAVVGSSRGIVKRALAVEKGVASTPGYGEVMGLLPKGWDAYAYAHDDGGALTALLGETGKGWHRLILALLRPARRVGIALDVVDRDRSDMVLVLAADGRAQVREIRERLEPALSAMVGELLDGRIRPELAFEELPNALRINAKLSGTAPFWRSVFGGRSGRGKAPPPKATPGGAPPAAGGGRTP
ncbi:MAG: hypothetical protein PHN82_02200 [bacterium]|nr:hypothetical protein [bacterium]